MSRSDSIVELHFIDGPLQGTRKMEQRSTLLSNRTYRYLQPTRWLPEEKFDSKTENTAVKVVCSEHHYLPFQLPPTYGRERFAMILEKGLH